MINVIIQLFEAIKFSVSAYLWARKNFAPKVDNAIPQIHHFINRDPNKPLVYISTIIRQIPRVRIKSKTMPDSVIKNKADEIRQTLQLNEMQALAIGWNGSDVQAINAEFCDYAEVKAMRELSKNRVCTAPPVLSAGALLVCPTKRMIVLHQRSKASDTYDDLIHIFGGAYKPEIPMGKLEVPGDRSSLEFTMIREVFEESEIIVRRYSEPICVSREVDTGFIQYTYLGVRITKDQLERCEQNPEGHISRVPFDELSMKLKRDREWVPSGRALVLMWLSLGAPGAGFMPKFSGQTPSELFNAVTK